MSGPIFELTIKDFKTYIAEERLRRANYVLAFGSGKGGVGKSFIASLVALALRDMGFKVGVLDLDLHSSSIPLMLSSVSYEIESSKEGFEPYRLENLEVMSLTYFVGDRPVALRGKSKDEVVLYLLALTNWSKLDYLIIDLPPGMSDEVLNIAHYIRGNNRGIIAVTTPAQVSIDVVRKFIEVLKTLGTKVLGAVLNMSYIRVDGKILKPFGDLDVAKVEQILNTKVLAELPLEPRASEMLTSRRIYETELGRAIRKFVKKILDTVSH